jgi:beta-galactosidase
MKYPTLIPGFPKLLHGGDYNPEQWTPSVWAEDYTAMDDVRWNAVSVGIFSWVSLEPSEGQYNWEWLDHIFEEQAKRGGLVNLATPSAAMPAWMSQAYPEILRTGPDGVRRRHGNRVNFCWTSPIYREKTRAFSNLLAQRYGQNPALAMWHVSNEYGGECYCALCIQAFQKYLQTKYQSIEKLNESYWTAFWGHTYSDWSQIEAPGDPYGEHAIPGQTLDWNRFTSQQVIDFYLNESQPLRELTPKIPITTNLMGFFPGFDPHALAPHMDFASWDSYPFFSGPPHEIDAWEHAAMAHDMNRSLKNGRPFLLMEHSPSSTNWLDTMTLMRPNILRLQAVQALAHGADGIQYFQWRQGLGGSEHSHGAVMTHIDRTDTRVYQEVKATGSLLEKLDDLCGAATESKVAVIYDWQNKWCIDAQFSRRAPKLDYHRTVQQHHKALSNAGYNVDVISSSSPLDQYKLVVAPILAMLLDGQAETLANHVKDGGTLLLTYHSAWFDEHGLNFHGGYPHPLCDALGIYSEEVDELYPNQTNHIQLSTGEKFETGLLCERIHAESATVLATYGEQFYAGEPAITVNQYGSGKAYFVAAKLKDDFHAAFLPNLAKQAGVTRIADVTQPCGVRTQRRKTDTHDFLFLLNYTPQAQSLTCHETGFTNAETGDSATAEITLPPHGSLILRRPI